MKIYGALAKARLEIKVSKNGVNAFGKYKYIQITDIYENSIKSLEKNGIVTIPSQELLEDGYIKYKLTAYHVEDGSNVEVSLISKPYTNYKGMQGQQHTGTDNTYTDKYLYGKLLMLNDGATDVDSMESLDPQKEKAIKMILKKDSSLNENELNNKSIEDLRNIYKKL